MSSCADRAVLFWKTAPEATLASIQQVLPFCPTLARAFLGVPSQHQRHKTLPRNDTLLSASGELAKPIYNSSPGLLSCNCCPSFSCLSNGDGQFDPRTGGCSRPVLSRRSPSRFLVQFGSKCGALRAPNSQLRSFFPRLEPCHTRPPESRDVYRYVHRKSSCLAPPSKLMLVSS